MLTLASLPLMLVNQMDFGNCGWQRCPAYRQNASIDQFLVPIPDKYPFIQADPARKFFQVWIGMSPQRFNRIEQRGVGIYLTQLRYLRAAPAPSSLGRYGSF